MASFHFRSVLLITRFILNVSVLLRWIFQLMTESDLLEALDIEGCPPSSVLEFVEISRRLPPTYDVTSTNAQPVAPVVSLSHASVCDFLSTPKAGDFQLPHSERAYQTILDIYLEALMGRYGNQCLKSKQQLFLQYAAESWPQHLEEASKGDHLNVFFNDTTSGCLRRLSEAADLAGFLLWLRLHNPVETDLGVQPTKNLDDFRPMEFYIDMFNLHNLMTGRQRKLVKQEQQDDTSRVRGKAKYRILSCRPH